MSLFRYYITDLYEGAVRGTDNPEAAKSYAEVEDYFVVDAVTGEWLQPGGEAAPVKAITEIAE